MKPNRKPSRAQQLLMTAQEMTTTQCQDQMLADLRALGFCVIVFYPHELGGLNAAHFQETQTEMMLQNIEDATGFDNCEPPMGMFDENN